tara:strand:- start:1525 stop:1755 length:231 start_codon:yes stop_codon:yes gene_type:complete
MPLTLSEGVGFSVGVMNIWERYVDADSMHQLDMLRRQYTDESIIAYLKGDGDGMSIRVVNLEEFRSARKKMKLDII